jgi:hypothetical protein
MLHIKKKARNDWLAQINLPVTNSAEWLKSGIIIIIIIINNFVTYQSA